MFIGRESVAESGEAGSTGLRRRTSVPLDAGAATAAPGQFRSESVEQEIRALLKPREAQGSWRTDDARVVENIAGIVQLTPGEVARLLVSSGRLRDVISMYRLMTEEVEAVEADCSSFQDDVFAWKFNEGNYQYFEAEVNTSDPEFRSQWGLTSEHVILTRGGRDGEGKYFEQVAWISPDEFPSLNVLRNELEQIRSWRATFLRRFIAQLRSRTPR